MPAGGNPAVLRKYVDSDCLPFGFANRATRSSAVRSGRSAIDSFASPFARIASRNSAEIA